MMTRYNTLWSVINETKRIWKAKNVPQIISFFVHLSDTGREEAKALDKPGEEDLAKKLTFGVIKGLLKYKKTRNYKWKKKEVLKFSC